MAEKDTKRARSDSISDEEEVVSHPLPSLEEMGYYFDEELALRQKDTKKKFGFVDQQHYDKLGDAVTRNIQEQLVEKYGLIEVLVPLEDDEDNFSEGCSRSNIFVTPQYADSGKPLLLILQGSGQVRAGMWSRALCINDSLKTGSIFGYIEQALALNFEIIVLNPNFVETEDGQSIPGNESHTLHTKYVWNKVVGKSCSTDVVVVAHSYGGISMVKLLADQEELVLQKLKAIAMTDSVHRGEQVLKLTDRARLFFAERCINWMCSEEPLDAVLQFNTPAKIVPEIGEKPPKTTVKLDLYLATMAGRHKGVRCRSAGTVEHIHTSASSIEPVFRFLKHAI